MSVKAQEQGPGLGQGNSLRSEGMPLRVIAQPSYLGGNTALGTASSAA